MFLRGHHLLLIFSSRLLRPSSSTPFAMSIVPVPTPVQAEASPNGASSRPPQRSLNGVLSWLVEQTPEAVSAAARDSQTIEQMDEERRAFLSQTLGALQGSDHLSSIKVRTTSSMSRSALQFFLRPHSILLKSPSLLWSKNHSS